MHARALAEVFDAVLSDRPGLSTPRPVVSASWQRSLAAHVDPERRTPPVVYAADQVADIRAAHPLSECLPVLRSTLASIADEAMHVMLVTDAEGHILWRDGPATLLSHADGVGLFPGTRWSETAIGTNAMGTALAVDGPVQIHSAEHLVRTYHPWTCVAAPVHDPDTGAILGAVDISGPLHTVHPALLQLVSATARLAESELRARLAVADDRLRMRLLPQLAALGGAAGALVTPGGRVLAGQPYGWWPDRVDLGEGVDRVLRVNGREVLVEPLGGAHLLRAVTPTATAGGRSAARPLALRLMGDGVPSAVVDGRSIPLTLRLAEVLALLALHPEGLTGEQLAFLVYGDAGNQTTVRGEIRRLRALIGPDSLRTRPYRLVPTVDSDFALVHRALEAGRVDAALHACSGALLPRSDAPAVRELRDELVAGLRRAVLAAGDLDLLEAFAGHPLGRNDLEAHDRLVESLPPGDPRLGRVAFRRSRLQAD
ncbi:GAF domain-containing protein [Modestobacter sp. DSM 44400]|uniref:GAF domain-containing protein n=1 Tax=Modestobacter sp. DSM 44400 TaxID=1550230 RepID=UPI00089A71F1|nr:GAF domain-containing protein [Modestobacter sp. DSM 44400]SDY57649.1 GAF domain-containing protein [Modestobacter sp. DSM 44400]